MFDGGYAGNSNTTVASCWAVDDTLAAVSCLPVRRPEQKVTGWPWRLEVSLLKQLDRHPNPTYTFSLVAADGEGKESDQKVPVTLNLQQADLNPPKFSQPFYQADKLDSLDPRDLVKVTATDEDTGAEVEYRIVENGECEACWEIDTTGQVRYTGRPLPAEVVTGRLATLLVRATEQTSNTRHSDVVVLVPLAGDDHAPQASHNNITEIL